MRIKIAKGDYIHDFLLNTPTGLEDESEAWRPNNETQPRLNKQVCFRCNPISLPYPLERTGIAFQREGNFYFATIWISSRSKSIYENTSVELQRKLQSKFYPTSPHGAGYLLDDEKKKALIGIHTQDKGKDRLIVMGSAGAVPRKITDSLESFVSDVKEAEALLNTFLDVCISRLVKQKKIMVIPPELLLYL